MKRKDIEKAVVALGTYPRSSEVVHFTIQRVNKALDKAASQVPTTWLDPLLIDIQLPATQPVEQLLLAIKARIVALKIKG